MINVPLSLSVANVRQLKTQVKYLAQDLRGGQESRDIPGSIERAVTSSVRDDVIMGIASIQDVDGNYLGTDNPNASVIAIPVALGHSVIWSGEQIKFIEFGTGAAGAGSGKDVTGAMAAGHSADPTKTTWFYYDSKTQKAEMSHGLVPQAPMWNAAMAMRRAGALIPAKVIVEEELRRAFTL